MNHALTGLADAPDADLIPGWVEDRAKGQQFSTPPMQKHNRIFGTRAT